jgi:hypothetical protein
MSDESLSELDRTEYFAPPRRKELARDAILALEVDADGGLGDISTIPADAIVQLLRERSTIIFLTRKSQPLKPSPLSTAF